MMKCPELHIRRIRPGEGRLLKSIRLTALADMPEAFSETLDQARAVADEEYEARARAGAAGDEWVVLVATEGAYAAGIVAGHDQGDRVALVSMWVAPVYRRRGVARALIEKLLEWVATKAAGEVYLYVGDRNEAAKSLYASMGFVPTGRSQGLAWKPEVQEIEMVRGAEAAAARQTETAQRVAHNRRRSPSRPLKYAWALPNTLLGSLFIPAALASGGRAQLVDGVMEVQGGAVGWLLRRAVPLPVGAVAITLGHVVLGRDQESLRASRSHERVHVEQYERWGPLFLPAYFLAGIAAFLRGGHAYRDNYFERDARRRA